MIETERLLLREIADEDAPGIHAMNLDPEVNRYTGDGPFESVDATRAFYEKYRREVYGVHGFGRWTVIEKETGAFAGWCGLKRVEGEVDLGFRFAREFWGRGYATEAARACVEHGFGELNLDRIVAWSHPDNAASLRVLTKLGFQRYGKSTIEGMPVLLFDLTPGPHPQFTLKEGGGVLRRASSGRRRTRRGGSPSRPVRTGQRRQRQG